MPSQWIRQAQQTHDDSNQQPRLKWRRNNTLVAKKKRRERSAIKNYGRRYHTGTPCMVYSYIMRNVQRTAWKVHHNKVLAWCLRDMDAFCQTNQERSQSILSDKCQNDTNSHLHHQRVPSKLLECRNVMPCLNRTTGTHDCYQPLGAPYTV